MLKGNVMSYCSKEDLIEPVTRDIEELLIQQLGEKFALLEITTECGKEVFLRSNSTEAIEVKDKNILPRKRINLNDVQSESRITYTGSPTCVVRLKGGSSIVYNLDGGPVEDCLNPPDHDHDD